MRFVSILIFSGLLCFPTDMTAQVDIFKVSDVGQDTIAMTHKIFEDFDSLEKPGVSVAVVRDGKIIYKNGYGSAHLEYDVPISPSTVFHVASVSKQFTVFAILLLQREGKLSLDDDIRKYIPEVPDFGAKISLRHLATHTSGLRDQWDLLRIGGWRMDDVITTAHVLNLVSQQKELNFQPGEKYTYCNTGFTLLAEVVARVSGFSFPKFTQKRIFEPLKMERTLFYDDHERIVKDRAYSYKKEEDVYKKSRLNYAIAGATSLFTTAEDLALWVLNFQNPKVGNQAIIDQMNTLAVLNNGKTFGGAYGQFVGTYKGHKQIQHGGADAGYRSYLARFPKNDFAVITLSNFADSNPWNLALKVADLYLEDKTVPGDEEREPSVYKSLSAEHLKQFEGYYWNEKDEMSRQIKLENDTLRYIRSENNVTALAPVGFNKFEMLKVPSYVTVEFTKEDNLGGMIVSEDDENQYRFDNYIPIDLSALNISPYEGTYFCPELMTEYQIVFKNNELLARHFRLGEIPLKLIRADLMEAPGGIKIHMHRTEDGSVDGMKVSTGRASDLWFEKK
ncbi:MAG: serine hydrolase domain-containing protein [Flavobacteriaceae bacterium]